MTPTDGFPTDYSIYGRQLDVDALLAKARPRGRLLVWRRGEPTEFGEATTSGVTVPVFAGTSKQGLFRAVKQFLTRESAFLKTAHHMRGSRIHWSLNTAIFVRASQVPVGLELPPALLHLAATRGVPWAIMGVPCSKDGGVSVS